MEIRQRKGPIIGYDSRAATSEPASLFGCAGQQSDNGWRSLVEPAVPLGFLNAVRGGWRGSSAFISTFRDTHSCRPEELDCLSPLLFSAVLFFFHSPLPLALNPCFSIISCFSIFFFCFSFHLYSRRNSQQVRSEFLLRCRALLSFFLRVLIPIYPWGQLQISELLSGAIAVHAFATQTSQKLVFKPSVTLYELPPPHVC